MASGFIEPSMTRFSSYMMRKLLIMMRMCTTRKATSTQNRLRQSSCVTAKESSAALTTSQAATLHQATAPVSGSGRKIRLRNAMSGQQAAVHARSKNPYAADVALPMTLDMLKPPKVRLP